MSGTAPSANPWLSPPLLITAASNVVVVVAAAAVLQYRVAAIEARTDKLDARLEAELRERHEQRLAHIAAVTELRGAVGALQTTVQELRDTVRSLPSRRER